MIASDPELGTDAIVGLYIGTYAGRTDLYVENAAEVRREPLTPDVVRAALKHNYAISAFTASPFTSETGMRTHVGAIDFDTENGHDQAITVQRLLDRHNIPSLLVGSRRGAHLWVSLLNYTHAATMHRALTAAVALSAGQDAAQDPKVEVFPKRGEALAVGALRLPGMPHQRTQQVYPIYDYPGGGSVIEQPTFADLLAHHPLGMAEAIEQLAGRLPMPAVYPKAMPSFYTYAGRTHDRSGDPKASAVLEGWGLQARPGSTVRCPMHDDKRRSLTIYRDDERVYCGAPYCVLNNSGHGVGSIALAKMQGGTA